MKERRGRACAAIGTRKGRPPKLDKKVARGKEKAAIVNKLRQEYPLNDLL